MYQQQVIDLEGYIEELESELETLRDLAEDEAEEAANCECCTPDADAGFGEAMFDGVIVALETLTEIANSTGRSSADRINASQKLLDYAAHLVVAAE